MPLNAEIFRAYDIRGIVGSSLKHADVTDIGRVIGSYVLESGGSTIVLGRDGRLSSVELEQALAAGITKSGCNVVLIGMVPTPVLYFASHSLGIPSAVMITGSHNPKDYNGFKIIINGDALFGSQITNIYTRIGAQNWQSGSGSSRYYSNIIADYKKEVQSRVKLSKSMRIVVDAGNGAAGCVAPDLYSSLGCNVEPLYCDVDGNFPNHHPDPSDPNNLLAIIELLNAGDYDLGFAFDGDGDRLGLIDDTGKIIWPDRYLMLLLMEVLIRNPGASIIYDIKSSAALAEVIRQHGGEPVIWKTGHSLIKAKMKELNSPLGGEMSGHVFFKDRWFGFDDALYTGARLLECLSAQNKSCHDIFSSFPENHATPEIAINMVSEQAKFSLMEKIMEKAKFSNVKNLLTLDGLRVEFQDGWGLLRPSNTAPKLVARFEGVTREALLRIQKEFKQQLKECAPEIALPF